MDNQQIKKRQTFSTSDPNLEIVLTDDGSRTLRQVGTKTTWHSESGALAESRLVYLENSGLLDRRTQQPSSRILEVGFGTGLNFWLAASVALTSKHRLDFTTIEKELLRPTIAESLQHGSLSECQPGYATFFDSIFESVEDNLRAEDRKIEFGCVSLQLILDDATVCSFLERSFDIVFHDPFAPEVAPEFWAPDYLSKLHRWLNPSGRLVTYCVKSSIQRTLRDVGFKVQKTPGPKNGKREVLIAFKE